MVTWAALVIVAVMALMIGTMLGRGPDQARADSVQSGVAVTCTSPIGPIETEIPVTAADDPDPVAAGDQMTISYTTDYPDVVLDSFTINSARATWPMPPEVESVDGVTFSGGDPRFTSSHEVIDGAVVTIITGDGTTSGRPPTPTVNVEVTIAADAAGSTINWPVFASFVSNADTFVGNVDSTCTPDDAGVVLNTTAVVEGGGQTTTTTVPDETTTTLPDETTTTTLPDGTTTTTAPPPTTTVPPPTTTVPPPTTTTPPPTTTTTVPGEEPPPPTPPPPHGEADIDADVDIDATVGPLRVILRLGFGLSLS